MKKLLLALPLLALAGCTTDEIRITAEPIERAPLVVPSVDTYSHREVKWHVVTPENAAEVFQELGRRGQGVALFALSSKGYENLSLNFADQLKFIRQTKAVAEAYESYYIRQTEILDKIEAKK